MIVFKTDEPLPNQSYVTARNTVVEADAWLTDLNKSNFSIDKECVVIFYIVAENTISRKYVKYDVFDKFDTDILNALDFEGIDPQGALIFFKGENFLKDFIETNNHIL